MPLTIAPAEEACQALVAWLNAEDTPYTLAHPAAYGYLMFDLLEEISTLRVDLVHISELQIDDTLDAEGRTSHTIFCYIRSPLADTTPAAIGPLKLLERQLHQRLEPFVSGDFRVRVAECDFDDVEKPDKQQLQENRLFLSLIALRVEVAPP